MLIKTVEVKNFRAIRDEVLQCDDLTALVGRNGGGKSSFLYAIDIFYNVSAPISQEDFWDHDVNVPIEIRVTFGDLRTDEKEEFGHYIKDEKLIVSKKISFENGKLSQRYYGAALQIPEFAAIRAMTGKKDRTSAWNELLEAGTFADLGGKAKTADDVERLMSEYEASHPDLMQPIEREEQFFGPRSIGGGKLDKYTKYVLVPAVREASDEASGKKGAIYQLLDMIVLRKVNARKDIQDFRSEFEQRVKKLYSSDNLTELPELGDSISETLEKFSPGSHLRLRWDEVKPPEVQLPAARATLIEDNFEGEINYKGHGLQRALIVTLLQHLAMTAPSPPPTEGGTGEGAANEQQVGEAVQGPDLILAIEEPELYLHPSRCRYLSDLLFQLIQKPDLGLGSRNQVIYATHSPYFVDLFRFNRIRMIRKSPLEEAGIPQTIVQAFTLEQAAKNLAEVCEEDPARFTEDSFRARAMSVMNTIVNEGFFADAVVVVEGQTELGALWRLQDILKANWPQLGIAIVPAGGKNNIDRPVVVFRGFSIPTYFLFDGDMKFKGKTDKETIRRNRCYLRLAGVAAEDFPETQVHDTWAVFEENFEELMKSELGEEYFLSLCDKVASELGYQEPSKVLKNIEGSACFIEKVYADGKTLPILELVVNNITKLREKP